MRLFVAGCWVFGAVFEGLLGACRADGICRGEGFLIRLGRSLERRVFFASDPVDFLGLNRVVFLRP